MLFCWISDCIIARFWTHCGKDPSQLFAQVFVLCLPEQVLLVVQELCHSFFSVPVLGDSCYAVCKDTESATTKPSYPSPASHPPPAIWLIVSRHYYCCLAIFSSLVTLYERAHRDLSVSRAQWVLWGYILSTGFWYISIIFHSFGKKNLSLFLIDFNFLSCITVESSSFCVWTPIFPHKLELR